MAGAQNMSPPLSESDVRDREKWENVDERVEIDKLNTCDGKASNDLLYMYSLKDRAETGMDRTSCSGFPKLIQYQENLSEHYTIKMHGKVTDNTRLAPIRLKSEEELLEKKNTGILSPKKLNFEDLKQFSNHTPSSPSTPSPPSNSKPGVRRGVSCTMWIHLQASICTEWAQENLVLKHQSTEHPQLWKTDSLKNTTFQANLDSLRKLQRETPSNKPPRTIHRCILKTSSLTKDPKGSNLECHVCNTRYSNYSSYFTHLIDNTCVRNQEGERISSTQMAIYATHANTSANKSPRYLRNSNLDNIPKYPWDPSTFLNSHRTIPHHYSFKDESIRTDALLSPVKDMRYMEVSGNAELQPQETFSNGASLSAEYDMEPDVQIVSEQIRQANSEPTSKKIRLDADESTNKTEDFTLAAKGKCHIVVTTASSEDITNHKQYDSQKSVSEYSGQSFDEKAASETLLLLSNANGGHKNETFTEEQEETNQSTTQSEPEVTSSCVFQLPVLCPCERARRLKGITPEENSEDTAKLVEFTAKLTVVLTQLLGERRLGQLGYPAISGRDLLEKVLRLTGTTITREDDLCTDNCKVR